MYKRLQLYEYLPEDPHISMTVLSACCFHKNLLATFYVGVQTALIRDLSQLEQKKKSLVCAVLIKANDVFYLNWKSDISHSMCESTVVKVVLI